MDPLEFGSEDQVKKGHPAIVATHVGFRGAAIFLYMFGSIFTSSFVTVFIFILLCLAADFWVVKNVTGRFLVGLRWRNQVDPITGNSTWVYESRSEEGFKRKPVMPNEFRIFWGALIIGPILWTLFGLMALFTFKWIWFIVCVTGLSFNGANLYGYIRCKVGGADAVKNMAGKFVGAQMFKSFMSSTSATATAGAGSAGV